MTIAHPLPPELTRSHRDWKAAGFAKNEARFRKLAGGQSPAAMVISCCDSRVVPTNLFGVAEGDFFVHRNIANLVPPFGAGGSEQGTAAAVEYAVTALKVSHLIVMGHSACGGVRGYHDMVNGNAPGLADRASFVGRWIEHLAPGYDRVKQTCDGDACADALEKEGVKMSLDNLMTYAFVKSAVEAETLTLHGLWNDIGAGDIWWFDATDGAFKPL